LFVLVDGWVLPICFVIDGTMNLEPVDVYEINDKVLVYSPLLSDEAKDSGWTKNPPGAFGGLGYDGYYRKPTHPHPDRHTPTPSIFTPVLYQTHQIP
jgi:hypothetical protein